MGDFTTRKEAYQYIVNRLGAQNSLWNARWDYIDKWVDAIEVPEMDYKEWLEYLKKYKLSGSTWTPKNFKENLISYLKSSYSVDIEGYNPPHADFGSNNLFIVEKIVRTYFTNEQINKAAAEAIGVSSDELTSES
jgi:hypothetical protein